MRMRRAANHMVVLHLANEPSPSDVTADFPS